MSSRSKPRSNSHSEQALRRQRRGKKLPYYKAETSSGSQLSIKGGRSSGTMEKGVRRCGGGDGDDENRIAGV